MVNQHHKHPGQYTTAPPAMFGVERLGATGPFAALMREVEARGASQGGRS
jgi:hypothetical protein